VVSRIHRRLRSTLGSQCRYRRLMSREAARKIPEPSAIFDHHVLNRTTIPHSMATLIKLDCISLKPRLRLARYDRPILSAGLTYIARDEAQSIRCGENRLDLVTNNMGHATPHRVQSYRPASRALSRRSFPHSPAKRCYRRRSYDAVASPRRRHEYICRLGNVSMRYQLHTHHFSSVACHL
jgi:hypothetical protein